MGVAVANRFWMDCDELGLLSLPPPQAYRPTAIAAVGTPTIKARRNMCEAPDVIVSVLVWPRGLWGTGADFERPFFDPPALEHLHMNPKRRSPFTVVTCE